MPDTGPKVVPKQLSLQGVKSIHPNALIKVMKQSDIEIENEEEILKHKGGFLKQSWLAFKFIIGQVL